MQTTPPSPDLSPTAEQVEDYLRAHPDFFDLRLTVLGDMLAATLPEPAAGGAVVDFQAHALRALRHEISTLREGIRHLADTARHNLEFQQRTHDAARVVLQAGSFDALVRAISDDAGKLLDVDVIMLCFERGLPKGAAIYLQELSEGSVDRLLGDGTRVRLRPLVEAEPLLYGSDDSVVKSDALVRLTLGDGLPEGLLALGSRRPGTFSPEQGSELLTFFADVVTACVHRWIGQ